jgi:hypothetical protein
MLTLIIGDREEWVVTGAMAAKDIHRLLKKKDKEGERGG